MLLCCFNPIVPIAVIFAYRWAIEIFFRFFKHMLGCRHLLSHKQNGIEIQTYSAIIACMLIATCLPTAIAVPTSISLYICAAQGATCGGAGKT